MLFLGIVEHQAESHSLARRLTIRQAPHAGQNGSEPRLFVCGNRRTGFAVLCPLRGDPFEVG